MNAFKPKRKSVNDVCVSFCLLQTGKPLMFRSEPPQTRRKQQDADKKQDKEEEELKYFFT